MTGPVLVGVDGSLSAENAVRWAARTALVRRLQLRLVHAVPRITAYTPVTVPRSFEEALKDQGRQWLEQGAVLARQEAPGVEVATDLLDGVPAAVLVDLSRSARMVVLGSRGLGGFTGLLVGSVAVTLAAHGHCPVVVVRGDPLDAPPPETGPVVVGVDGTAASEAAVAFAFDEASRWDTPLVAVHSWNDAVSDALWGLAAVFVDWEAIEADGQQLLAQRLAGWQEQYPDVSVRQVVTRGAAARALLDQAGGARLVVVGSRGRGGVRGMLLGSTSQALLHHAPCPVVVVRPQPGR